MADCFFVLARFRVVAKRNCCFYIRKIDYSNIKNTFHTNYGYIIIYFHQIKIAKIHAYRLW